MIQKNDDKEYLVYDQDVIIQVYDEGVLVFGMSLDKEQIRRPEHEAEVRKREDVSSGNEI